MTDDYDFHKNKRTDKTYISKSLSFKDQPDRKIRIASKVIDSPESHLFALEHGEHVVRVTEGGRQEIVAKFYEDNRGVFVLTIQRYTTETGMPHHTHFSFVGEEIPILLDFISNLRYIYFPNDGKVNITDLDLNKQLLSEENVRSLVIQNQDIVLELAKSEIAKSDIVALGYRRQQLKRYERLLFDSDYFEHQERELGKTGETLWQSFFEQNKWIFGYGLTYVFLMALEKKKLEQIVAGFDIGGKGKRGDALMKTRGAIESLCFVEIKTHTTSLLQSKSYRSGCWAPSDELTGGISQVQGTVASALRGIPEKFEPTNADGDPTGEELFAYQPKSFLVIGSLSELRSNEGTNLDKYRSFELFRRNIHRPEIITFDELYHRAKFIVENID